MPDDHSKLVPLLPIPNRTVKRLSADDSADSRVKVGHRQALTTRKPPVDRVIYWGFFRFTTALSKNLFPSDVEEIPAFFLGNANHNQLRAQLIYPCVHGNILEKPFPDLPEIRCSGGPSPEFGKILFLNFQ